MIEYKIVKDFVETSSLITGFINRNMTSDNFFSQLSAGSFVRHIEKYRIRKELSVFMTADDKLIGLTLCGKDGNSGYIALMVIDEEFRNQGLGKCILDKQISLFKENNCNHIILEVNSDNQFAIKLYQSRNFIISFKICNYVNNHNSFFKYTTENNDFTLEKSDWMGFRFFKLSDKQEKKPRVKNSAILEKFLRDNNGFFSYIKYKDRLCGYVIFTRNNYTLEILDISNELLTTNFIADILSLLRKDERIIQFSSVYMDSEISVILENLEFYPAREQYEMELKL